MKLLFFQASIDTSQHLSVWPSTLSANELNSAPKTSSFKEKSQRPQAQFFSDNTSEKSDSSQSVVHKVHTHHHYYHYQDSKGIQVFIFLLSLNLLLACIFHNYSGLIFICIAMCMLLPGMAPLIKPLLKNDGMTCLINTQEVRLITKVQLSPTIVESNYIMFFFDLRKREKECVTFIRYEEIMKAEIEYCRHG